ncbi:MAG: hypothetical protein IKG56_01470 [Clostridia bacterium]|nr:hypothetical protein [Clostridia bacterium]
MNNEGRFTKVFKHESEQEQKRKEFIVSNSVGFILTVIPLTLMLKLVLGL